MMGPYLRLAMADLLLEGKKRASEGLGFEAEAARREQIARLLDFIGCDAPAAQHYYDLTPDALNFWLKDLRAQLVRSEMALGEIQSVGRAAIDAVIYLREQAKRKT